eukprot:7391803-Prymnesium_polylepis.2
MAVGIALKGAIQDEMVVGIALKGAIQEGLQRGVIHEAPPTPPPPPPPPPLTAANVATAAVVRGWAFARTMRVEERQRGSRRDQLTEREEEDCASRSSCSAHGARERPHRARTAPPALQLTEHSTKPRA